MKVIDLKALAKECGLQGYSKLRKAELITFLQNNLQPTPAPLPSPAWEPRPTPHTSPLVRFKPDRPQLPDSQNPKPYQLKPKKGKEIFIE